MHKAEMQPATAAKWEKEEVRLARLPRSASHPDLHSPWEQAQWSPWPESQARSGFSRSASPTGGASSSSIPTRRGRLLGRQPVEEDENGALTKAIYSESSPVISCHQNGLSATVSYPCVCASDLDLPARDVLMTLRWSPSSSDFPFTINFIVVSIDT
jgi:hypothetical protein